MKNDRFNKHYLYQNKNEKDEKEEKSEKSSNLSKIFWRSFWITIIILASVYVGIKIEVYRTSKALYEKHSIEEKKKTKNPFLTFFKEKLPKHEEEIKENISKAITDSQQEIKETIDYEIEKAFYPVYNHIDDFIDFHYSVTGEYTELAEMLFNETSSALKEHLFKPAHLDQNLQEAIKNINEKSLDIINSNIRQATKKLKESANLNDEEIEILTKALQISQEDIFSRFSNISYTILRGGGMLAGALGASLGAKLFAKKIGKVLAAKLAAKIAVKTGAKAAGSGGMAATGASVGALFGGPIGATIGGVAGAIAGWFATDKIVVEIDQFLHEDEFREKIINLIDEQKNQTKEKIMESYDEILNEFRKEQEESNEQGLEKLKNVPIKDIM